MTCSLRVSRVLVLTALVSACGKSPVPLPQPTPPVAPAMTIAAPADQPVSATMTLSATADANPDANGRPSSVVLRVYQLRTDAAFTGAEFFSLYEDDMKALGAELISRDEYVLLPSGSRSVSISVGAGTRFVGVLAAYRDIRSATWRAVASPPRKSMTVVVERSRVLLSVE